MHATGPPDMKQQRMTVRYAFGPKTDDGHVGELFPGLTWSAPESCLSNFLSQTLRQKFSAMGLQCLHP